VAPRAQGPLGPWALWGSPWRAQKGAFGSLFGLFWVPFWVWFWPFWLLAGPLGQNPLRSPSGRPAPGRPRRGPKRASFWALLGCFSAVFGWVWGPRGPARAPNPYSSPLAPLGPQKPGFLACFRPLFGPVFGLFLAPFRPPAEGDLRKRSLIWRLLYSWIRATGAQTGQNGPNRPEPAPQGPQNDPIFGCFLCSGPCGARPKPVVGPMGPHRGPKKRPKRALFRPVLAPFSALLKAPKRRLSQGLDHPKPARDPQNRAENSQKHDNLASKWGCPPVSGLFSL